MPLGEFSKALSMSYQHASHAHLTGTHAATQRFYACTTHSLETDVDKMSTSVCRNELKDDAVRVQCHCDPVQSNILSRRMLS